jgi:uncharacterized protein YbjT (DUF2867 family)
MFVVTGATGRTGTAVVEGLLKAGHEVRAVGRSASRLREETAGAEQFVAEPTDRDALARAFAGAEGVYAMVQPNYIPDSDDFPGHQRRIVEAIVGALDDARVTRVVTLSSWGADKPDGTGPVTGLHHLEQAVNRLGAKVTHLRAGYFMENLLGQVPAILDRGVVAAPFSPDVPMPFVTAPDIGYAAAETLLEPGPAGDGPEIREIQGERDLSMSDVVRVVARLAGRPELRYVQQSIQEFTADQRAAGVSENVTALMVEVAHAINSGHTRALQPRTARTSTPTSIEQFVTSTMLPALGRR